MMLNLFAIFLGGGIGAVLRYLAGLYFSANFRMNMPASTFIVNILGSFILGFLYILFIDKPEINTELKVALTVGFCGGFTTFSTFSLEIFEMLGNSNFYQAGLYILTSLLFGLIAVGLGVYCAKLL